MHINFKNKLRTIPSLALATLICLLFSCQAHAGLINGEFEDPVIIVFSQFMDQSALPGWQTTATDGQVEIWKGPTENGGVTFEPYEGSTGPQWAELNANQTSALFQEVDATTIGIMEDDRLHFGFAHRGRGGTD
ncbi:MAG: hypothetical protein AAF497_24100, partial [Planctomycetota bacterium]